MDKSVKRAYGKKCNDKLRTKRSGVRIPPGPPFEYRRHAGLRLAWRFLFFLFYSIRCLNVAYIKTDNKSSLKLKLHRQSCRCSFFYGCSKEAKGFFVFTTFNSPFFHFIHSNLLLSSRRTCCIDGEIVGISAQI